MKNEQRKRDMEEKRNKDRNKERKVERQRGDIMNE
jgi:hypothetical protein